MDNKAFLERCRSQKSTDTSSGFNVRLKGNRKLLPLNDVADVISLTEQYDEERAACNKIRLSCQVNTVCSNVLFNYITEIVKYEGSSGVTFLNYKEVSDSEPFNDPFGNNQVLYKPSGENAINFWSGGIMSYQKQDERLMTAGPSTDLTRVDKTALFKNDTLEGNEHHPTNAIRDTQLSKFDTNGDSFVYHCGLDIFNNHLIRSKTFKCICKLPGEKYDDVTDWKNNAYNAFNTIADVMRQENGDKVVEKIYLPENSGLPEGTKVLTLHTYLYDNIMPFVEARVKRLIEKHDGWLGFLNSSKIKTYKDFRAGEELGIERPIMYMNGGDFVDMYPGRDLYSFVPKYNKYRNRMEQNWLYCITYPSSSVTEGFEDIIETSNNSLKAMYFDETRRADNGAMQLVIYSKAKHGLAPGDRVNIYKNYRKIENDKSKRVSELVVANVEVNDVVNDFIFTTFNQGVQISDKWVTISDDDFRSPTGFTVDDVNYLIAVDGGSYVFDKNDNRYYIINNKYVNLDDTAQNISYKKVVNEVECDYYVRIFSRLPNFRFSSGDTSSEYNIYKKQDGEKNMLEKYQQVEYPFESQLSRLAFANNIYSDEMGQIVFTDDIDISNIHDNLGRPISEIYLTIVKNNRGYKEWYGYDGVEVDINSPNVEYSHCFGRITCGFEMAEETVSSIDANNIRTISPFSTGNWGYSIGNINGDRGDNTPDHEIVFDKDIHYYGDLCYFDSYNAIERVIQPMLHRFNTAQRECGGSNGSSRGDYFSQFIFDEIKKDDYDSGDAFIIGENTFDKCNQKAEGYFYQPHHRIQIKSFGKLNTVMPQFLNMQSLVNIEMQPNGDIVTRITTQEYHFLTPGDKAVIYDMNHDKHYYLTTVSGDWGWDNDRVFTCIVRDEKGNITDNIDGDNLGYYKLFKADNLGIPSYANLVKDGTCRYIWRNIINNGSMESEDGLEVYPFTNGAFYVNKLVNLYVRRQDPDDIYGLYDNEDTIGVMPPSEDANNYSSEDEIKC